MKQIESMSERDLVEIIERASTIDERLGDDFVPAESGDAALAERRLEAWSQALGNGDWDRLRRRLAWDGLDPESVRPALGPVCLREGVPLPEWSKLLAEALRLAPTERQEDEAWPTEMGFLDAEDALPFEEVLAPFVLVARERLAGRTAAFGNLLSAPARAALERYLLRSLSYVSDEILLTEFETMRDREQSSWDRLFALAQEPEGRSLYRQFIRRLGEGRMARLLKQYPVLARHMGTISQLWVEAGAEFLGRLEADISELERLFGDDEELGNVVELKPSLSDPHRGGRSVIALTFASGRKLVYKPKDMGTEAAYHRLLAWLNERGAPLPFKVLRVLDRSTHGWVEFVEHLPCRDQDEARRYYERAGMLLCLFYALEGTDCHYESTAPPHAAEEVEEGDLAGPPADETFVAPALDLAEAIRSHAIRTEDGSAAWIAPQCLVQAEHYQLQPMDFELYGGTSGVSLFLAAAERFAPEPGYGELALAALRPLQSTLDRRPDRLAGMMGIGGASGLGSVAYSLLHVSHLLDEPVLLEDARRVTDLITEDVIASDRALHVIGPRPTVVRACFLPAG